MNNVIKKHEKYAGDKQCATAEITPWLAVILSVAGILFGVFLCPVAQAYEQGLIGAHFKVSRVIYPAASSRGVSVVFYNTGSRDYLIQSYIREQNVQTGLPGKPTGDILVLPPLFRLNAGDSNTLRLLRTGGEYPSDRESVFFLTERMVPSGQSQTTPGARLVQELSIKVFYRPGALPKSGIASAVKTLEPRVSAGRVTLHNPSPFWLTLRTLSVGGRDVPPGTLFPMVPPFGEQSWPLPPGPNGKEGSVAVGWRAIDEQGMDTDEVSKTVRIAPGNADGRPLGESSK